MQLLANLRPLLLLRQDHRLRDLLLPRQPLLIQFLFELDTLGHIVGQHEDGRPVPVVDVMPGNIRENDLAALLPVLYNTLLDTLPDPPDCRHFLPQQVLIAG